MRLLKLIGCAILFAPIAAQGQNWHLEYGPNRQVVIYSTLDNSYPGGSVTDFQLMLAIPPLMPGRQNIQAEMHVIGCKNYQSVQGTKPGRSLIYEHLWFQPGIHQINFDISYTGSLQACRIVPGSPAQPAPALTKAESHEFLSQNSELDFKAPSFRSFMEQNGLLRRAGESDIDLAWRFFRYITQKYHYGGGPPHILTKLAVGPGSDCGGISEIFTGMCRFSGIPARLLVGRNVGINDKIENSYHVQSEFYVPRVGWIPVDATFGLQQGKGAAQFFGNRHANFLVCEYDVDLPLKQKDCNGETIANSKLGILQGPCLWIGGTGNLAAQTNNTWKVYFP